MRHLKSYKLFETNTEEFATEQELQNIEDILLPIEDSGYSVDIFKNIGGQEEELESDGQIAKIYIELKGEEEFITKPFMVSEDMIETIDRLIDYINQTNYIIDIDCIFMASGYLGARDWSKVRELNHEIDYIKILIEYID